MSGVEIADNIRAERNRARLSSEEVAKQLDIARETYTRYESDASKMQTQTLLNLSRIFNCNVNDFFIHKVITVSDK